MNEQKEILILDGGTGMSLVDMGHKFIDDDPLWSAAIVYTHPDDLIKLHKNFYEAGADVVVTASYQASVDSYKKKFGLSDAEAIDLLKKSTILAKTARDEAEKSTGRHGYVAASVGPYGALQNDRSEYHGNYCDKMTREELSSWHQPRLQLLVESQPDLLAIETIPAVVEAEAILDCMSEFPNTKLWVTFQCKDDNGTAHGEPIQDALHAVINHANSSCVVALGMNCVNPCFVTPLLQKIAGLSLNLPVIVKPNSGIFQHDGSMAKSHNLAEHVQEWIEAGASWVGGCCYIYPSDILNVCKVIQQLPNVSLARDKKKKLF